MSKDKKKENETLCGLNRRGFLKTLGFGGALALGAGASTVKASTETKPAQGPMGVLVDTTLCVGCRSCEAACNEANKLPKPEKAFDDETVLDEIRDTSVNAFTVVNRYTMDDGTAVTRKRQCMHCLEPACSSACIIRAMEKRQLGPVTYRKDLCLGCRYCMVACPFGVPKFEYSKAAPLVRKCEFCFERQVAGKPPACVEACPMGALTYGPRDMLLDDARKRIYTSPESYIHHIYGEHEAGGTSWLYLAKYPFDKLGLPKLTSKPYPEYTMSAMAAVPMVMLIWPAILIAFHRFSHNDDKSNGAANHGGR